MDEVIYLDYNASTPCDPRVVEEMEAALRSSFANPSSRSHRPGQRASAMLEDARSRVARALGARSASEITFTSGATEANNLAIRGVSDALAESGRHLISQRTEHASVLEPLRQLARSGWSLSLLEVGNDGRIRLDELEAALSSDTALVSLMLANNETGTVQPLTDAVDIVHRHGALIHCDAAQAFGKVEITVDDLEVDYLSFSAHKAYGPKGVGGLYSRRQRPPLRIRAQLLGGGQENGLRSGTPNPPAAVAMASALEIAQHDRRSESEDISALRDLLEQSITTRIDGCTINGAIDHRLPGTSNLSFDGVDGNALMVSLPELAISSGSACTSNHPEPSYVLGAMGVAPALAAASIRFSLGRFTTREEIETAADRVVEEVTRLREMKRRK
jgi:cysteine desulfurase